MVVVFPEDGAPVITIHLVESGDPGVSLSVT